MLVSPLVKNFCCCCCSHLEKKVSFDWILNKHWSRVKSCWPSFYTIQLHGLTLLKYFFYFFSDVEFLLQWDHLLSWSSQPKTVTFPKTSERTLTLSNNPQRDRLKNDDVMGVWSQCVCEHQAVYYTCWVRWTHSSVTTGKENVVRDKSDCPGTEVRDVMQKEQGRIEKFWI